MAYLLALSEHEEYQSIHHIYQLQINYKLLHSGNNSILLCLMLN